MAGMFEAAVPAILGGIASTVVGRALAPKVPKALPSPMPSMAAPMPSMAAPIINYNTPAPQVIQQEAQPVAPPTPVEPPAPPLNPSLTAASIRAQEEAMRMQAARTTTQLASRAARDEEILVNRPRLGG